MENFYSEKDFCYVEIAVAADEFLTTASSAPFYIPAIQPFTTNTMELRPYPPQYNIANKVNNLGISGKNIFTGHIDIPIYGYMLGPWKDNRVPKGAQFMVVFVGGDITKPRIIGRY